MRVSVLSANFNNAPYLDAYFESLLRQELEDFEIVLVDDGSSDASVEVCRRWVPRFGGRLKLLALEKNVGFANALNHGLGHCAGQYIARLDPDDTCAPSRLRAQVRLLEENPGIAGVGTNASYFESESGAPKGRSNFVGDPEWVRQKYRQGEHGVLHGTTMIRADVFRRYRYEQQAVPAEDYALFASMSRDGFVLTNLVEPLTAVRIHAKSVSNSLPFSTIQKTFAFRDRIFGTRTSRLYVKRYHAHLRNYRQFLFQPAPLRYAHFLAAVLSCPVRSAKIAARRLRADEPPRQEPGTGQDGSAAAGQQGVGRA